MDMLYFDDMPIDWQLSMLNNSQNGDNNVDINLLNQISNNTQNTKEILELKMSDNQLEHFLTSMDQPMVNPYSHEQINTTQNINTLPTTAPLMNQQFINTNAINNPQIMQNINNVQNVQNVQNIQNVQNVQNIHNVHNVQNVHNLQNVQNVHNVQNVQNVHNIHNIHNTTISMAPIKTEANIPINFSAGEQYKNIDNQHLIQEYINNKVQTVHGHANNINNGNYSSLVYNQEMMNQYPNNTVNPTTVGTKRKETMPELNNNLNNTSNKKIKKITASHSIPSHTQPYVIPSTMVASTTVVTTANLPPTNLNNNAVMSLPVNNYSNNMQPSTTANIHQDPVLLQYINSIENKELPPNTTVNVNNIPDIMSTLIASTNQNMNTVMATTDPINSHVLPNTTAPTVVGTQNNFIPNITTPIKTEANVSTNHYISPELVDSMNTLENHQQLNQINQQMQMDTSVSDNTGIPLTTTGIEAASIKTTTVDLNLATINTNSEIKTINDTSSLLRKVKAEETNNNEAILSSNENINESSTSTKVNSNSTSSPPTANSVSAKYTLNVNNTNSSSSSNNPKLNSVSWVKTQEKSEMKMAISRLKTNEPVVPAVPLQVIKHQKKVAHNAIERRYRNNINDRIKQLQDVIPALQYTKNIKEREKNQKDKGGGDDDVVKIDESLIIDGIPAARKLNKATVLKSATDYIVHLKKTSTNLKEENKRLLDFIKKMGGDEMLSQFTQENGDLYEDKSTTTTTQSSQQTNSTSSSSQTKEKGKRKEKGKQSRPVQEASPPHIYNSDSPSPTHLTSPPSVSTTSNEDDGTMLEILSGERENQRNNIEYGSNSTFTSLMVSLLLFSVGLFEYGSYLNNNSDAMSHYENYEIGRQGKVLLARSDEPMEKTIAQETFYQYIKSKFIRMGENLIVFTAFYIFIISLFILVGRRLINKNKESRNKCISSIASYSLFEKYILLNRSINELVGLAISKISRHIYNKIFYLEDYSYTKLILSHCRMIERDILITKNKGKQSLIAVFYTTLQIINNIKFVTNEISYSTCAYILYTTAIQFYINFRDVPFGKTIALRIWKKGNYYVSKTNEDNEDYEKSLKQSKKHDDYKRKRKIDINNEAIDFILNYINDNTEKCEKFFSKGHWISFLDRNTIEMSNSFYDFTNQKCLLITFSTAFKYDVLLQTFKEHGLKYIYMAPSVHNKTDESTEIETESELESSNNSVIEPISKDKKQIKEEFKNNYLSLSGNYFNNNLFSTLEAPFKIMNKLISDKKSKKKEKELNKIMKIDKILETIVKVANGSLILNDINLYWYAQILWIMVSWKKEYFKPIMSEKAMDKINIQLFYADQFRKLIISSVSSYYSDVVHDGEINYENEEEEKEKVKSNNSDDLYSTSSSEEDIEKNKDVKEKNSESESESESEYISEFKTETIPETESSSNTTSSSSKGYNKSTLKLETKNINDQITQNMPNRNNNIPHYSTVHFISDSTRQFITLSLFTWLMVQKKKYTIAKRSVEKAYQILEKITNVTIHRDQFVFTSLFEEENDYFPHTVLKFERIVVILAGTWLVEAEKIILNEGQLNKDQKQQSIPLAMTTKELTSTMENSSPAAVLPSEQQNALVVGSLTTTDNNNDEEELELADDVISLPKLPLDEEATPSTVIPTSNKSSTSNKVSEDSVVPKISCYVSSYVERYIKLIHYYQEMLPFIGSDKIAMECFKTIQRYQNDLKAYTLEL